jgi:nucleoside-diphosphate-sugar epimerase
MIDPIRPEARSLFVSALRPSDRVLVTGAGGWFGSTLAALLHGSGLPTAFSTQRPRVVSYGPGAVDASGWDWTAICDFAPTVVFDCAFLLRDYLGSVPLERYVYVNTMLTSRLLSLAQLTSVRAVVSVSSGAAVHPDDASKGEVDLNPYGYLKRQAELALLALGDAVGTEVVVARPWSLSGGLVTRPGRYAFSNLVIQARSGAIRIEADHEVWRRYVGVDDFFAVALATAGSLRVALNSGGELVEFGDLADRISSTLGSPATISRAAAAGGRADDYYSRDDSWDSACASVDFRAAGLDEQIRAVDAALTALGH